ncbi:MAG: hypothetical protein FJW37_08485, partial [Acidobacteria bacterium]|nr:hypothetical protein [Acidobacteriota bacterium]
MRLLVVFLPLAAMWAQVTGGALSGYVTDPSGRALPHARVEAASESSPLTRQALTDSSGFYRFVALPPGAYRFAAQAPAFEPVAARGVIEVQARLRLDFQLPVAGGKQRVTVEAEARAIETESSELGLVLDRTRIQSLPLNRRDFLQLALLAPGVLPPVENSELSTRGAFAMHASGAREEFNNFLLDGVDNNDQNVNRYVLQPSVDAIQEFRIAANAYSAEYGRSAGAQVNVITRSGGGQWHGFAYEYLRNRRLDAGNFFDGRDKPKYIRNQAGAGAGGPLIRDRTFLFASLDAQRERRGLSRLATVPGLAEREGDLAGLGRPVFDPFTRAPFAGNRIPPSRISLLAPRVLALFPPPNQGGQTANFLGQPVLRDAQTQWSARLDHRLTPAGQLTLRYSYGNKRLFEPYAEESTDLPGFGDFVRDEGHNALIHYQKTFGPGTVNSILAGFNRGTRQVLPENHTVDVNRLWGVAWLPTRPSDFGFPAFNVAGFARAGDVTQLPIDRAATTYQLSEGLSLARGSHGLKLGAEIRNVRMNGIVEVFARGQLSFSGALTGAGIGDLLLGLPSLGIQSQFDNPQTQRTTSYSFYLQDDWKARPSLALNLGLRYEYHTPVTDPFNRMSVFDPARGAVAPVGTAGASRSGVKADRNNLAPRFGLAWTPRPNYVVRGGYGLYYDAGMAVVNSSLYFNPPFFNVRVFFPTAASLLTLDNPFPASGGITPPPALNTLSPDLATAWLQHWNLNLQREIGAIGVASLAYAGSKGTHLVRSRDLNQPRPAPGDLNARRPVPRFGNIFFIESGANSSYHSLQASFNRRLARAVSLLAAYTFSKSIDDTSAFLGTKPDKNFPQDSRSYHLERALSSYDAPHRATAAFLVPVPGLRDTEWSGILTAQSGQPFTPILRFDNSNTGNSGGVFGSDRPDLLRDP